MIIGVRRQSSRVSRLRAFAALSRERQIERGYCFVLRILLVGMIMVFNLHLA